MLRGFPKTEFESRAARAYALMRTHELDALLLTTPANVRYFSGFATQFWQSPTRPWFLLLPLDRAPIAVIPQIGEAGMAQTWVEHIRTWPSPQPIDDGVSLLSSTMNGLKSRFGRIGAELGTEMVLRMPVLDFQRLCDAVSFELVDGAPTIRALRMVKSDAEIERIRYVCDLASDAFEALPEKLRVGDTERDACAKLRMDMLARGADDSPYLIGVSGPGGYDNIIMGPTDRAFEDGDVLMIDTGTTFDGYFCDFDRNFAFINLDDAAKRAHEVVWQATEAGIRAARPGATAADVWHAQRTVLEAGGSLGSSVGRFGHGLGMQLTEPPSNMAGDDTVLKPGVVLTIEPGMEYSPGKVLVHEENLVVRDGEADVLSRRAPREMPIVGG